MNIIETILTRTFLLDSNRRNDFDIDDLFSSKLLLLPLPVLPLFVDEDEKEDNLEKEDIPRDINREGRRS